MFDDAQATGRSHLFFVVEQAVARFALVTRQPNTRQRRSRGARGGRCFAWLVGICCCVAWKGQRGGLAENVLACEHVGWRKQDARDLFYDTCPRLRAPRKNKRVRAFSVLLSVLLVLVQVVLLLILVPVQTELNPFDSFGSSSHESRLLLNRESTGSLARAYGSTVWKYILPYTSEVGS